VRACLLLACECVEVESCIGVRRFVGAWHLLSSSSWS